MRNRPMLVVFLTIFLDMLGFGILIPVIPHLFANPASPSYLYAGMDVSREWALIMLELLVASYPLGQFFAAPILGQLSDKYGRKPILAISLAGTCVSYIVFAIGISMRSLPILFASRILDGLTGGNVAVAQAVIADISTPANRAKNFGMVGVAFGLGFILGPVIGGLLSSPALVSWFDPTVPFYFAALLSAVNVISVMTQLNETHTHQSRELHITPFKSVHNIIRAFSLKSIFPLLFTVFLFQGGFTLYTTFASTYLIDRFHFTEAGIGGFFAYVGFWIVLTQGFILKKIGHAVSEHIIIRYSLITIAVALSLYSVATRTWHIYLLVPIYAIPIGLCNAHLISLISRSVDRRMQGEILGINASVLALAQTLPQTIITLVIVYLLHRSFSPAMSIAASSFVILAAGIYFWRNYTGTVPPLSQQ